MTLLLGAITRDVDRNVGLKSLIHFHHADKVSEHLLTAIERGENKESVRLISLALYTNDEKEQILDTYPNMKKYKITLDDPIRNPDGKVLYTKITASILSHLQERLQDNPGDFLVEEIS